MKSDVKGSKDEDGSTRFVFLVQFLIPIKSIREVKKEYEQLIQKYFF